MVPTTVDVAHKLFQIAGIIFAGIFAYYKFLRGRTFRPRLEPTLEAGIIEVGPLRHLKVQVRVKNVGLSKVAVDRKASGLRVFVYDGNGVPADKVSPVEWRRERTVDVFKDHGWVEPGETIEDNWLLSIPHSQQPAAFRLELKLAGPKTDWYANAVIEAPAQPAPSILSSLLGRLLPSSQQQHSGGYDESRANERS